jgi:hypothetical protein
MRKTLTMALIGGLAMLTAACSSSTQTEVTRPAGAAAGTVAHVGDTLDLKTGAGRPFSITLIKVIDPAQTAGSKTPKAGKRFVAVQFSITNRASHALDADANTDVNIIGATGHMYTAASGVSLSSCDTYPNGLIQLAPGKSRTGCVPFQFRTSVVVSKVQFYPAAGNASDFGTWRVP